MNRLQAFVAECEANLEQQKARLKEADRECNIFKEKTRNLEVLNEKQRAEISDLKQRHSVKDDSLKDLGFHLNQARKENEDLKYDNTLLYEKNV